MTAPEGWREYRLRDIICHTQLGGHYENGEQNEGIPLIKMGNIGRGTIDLGKVQRISASVVPASKDLLKKGDLLFNTRNTLDLVGKVAIWNDELPSAAFDLNLMKIEFDESIVASTVFMNFWFNSMLTLRKLRQLAIGTTSVAAIYLGDLEGLRIDLPSLQEQTKISEILSTWDRAIHIQDLISDKGDRLLRGVLARFFPIDHSDLHDRTVLGSLCDIIMGQSPSGNSYNQENRGLPLFQGNADIKDRATSPRVWTSEVTKKCVINDVLVSVRAPVGTVARAHHEGVIGRGLAALRASSDVSDLLYYALLRHESSWRRLEQGSTFTAINSSDLREFEIAIPKELKISDQLLTLCKRLDDYTRSSRLKLAALEQQKQGLMQKLLTGKVRVKV